MTTALQRLLRYPHSAVFDKSPEAETVFRLRHNDGAEWSIADEVMTVKAGSFSRSYDLTQFTVGTLASALAADGFQVSAVNTDLEQRSAAVLAEGAGAEGQSNNDRVQAFTSVLWALLSGYAVEMREAEYQSGQALLQMSITTAEGEWLDLWGALYGVPRLQGESDADFRPRIKREAFRLRVNAHAIEQAILDDTGWDVRIEEPWKEIFTLDKSVLSGPDRLYDGSRYGYHLIRPFTRDSVDWSRVLPIIERNRAAGVLVIGSDARRGAFVDATQIIASSAASALHMRLAVYEDRALLDYSAIEEVSILNHGARHRRSVLRRSSSAISGRGWDDIPWVDVPWTAGPYLVFSAHTRTYRVYYLEAEYQGQYWPAEKTWVTAAATWGDLNAMVFSGHKRS